MGAAGMSLAGRPKMVGIPAGCGQARAAGAAFRQGVASNKIDNFVLAKLAGKRS